LLVAGGLVMRAISCRSVCGGRWIKDAGGERKIQAEANPVWAASALRITIVPKASASTAASKRRLSAYGCPPCSVRVAV
jgi:hypothetical protein